MGWLHSRPKVGENDNAPKARYEKLPKGDPLRGCPECDPYIVTVFQKCGTVMQGGMSIAPLTWQEVSAFCHMSRTPLTAWEAEQVIMMSREYVSSRGMYDKEPGFSSPWCPELTEEQWEERAKTIQKTIDRGTR